MQKQTALGFVRMKPAFYARVSRDDLNCENQKKVLLEWAQRNGMNEQAFNLCYFKEEMSSRKTRPIKEQVLSLFRSGKVDAIIVTRIDRFARSLQELVANVEEIISAGGKFVSIMNGFDFDKKTYNASQQLMLNIFASFAQFEREIIRERTIEGLARVKAQGKKLGRPRKDSSEKTKAVQGVNEKTSPENPAQIPSEKPEPEKRAFIFNNVKGGDDHGKRTRV